MQENGEKWFSHKNLKSKSKHFRNKLAKLSPVSCLYVSTFVSVHRYVPVRTSRAQRLRGSGSREHSTLPVPSDNMTTPAVASHTHSAHSCPAPRQRHPGAPPPANQLHQWPLLQTPAPAWPPGPDLAHHLQPLPGAPHMRAPDTCLSQSKSLCSVSLVVHTSTSSPDPGSCVRFVGRFFSGLGQLDLF